MEEGSCFGAMEAELAKVFEIQLFNGKTKLWWEQPVSKCEGGANRVDMVTDGEHKHVCVER